MGFMEIEPQRRPKGDPGTGVRVSFNLHGGLSVTLWGDALAKLAVPEGCCVKVMLDADPAYPRLRLLTADDGKFEIVAPPGPSGRSDKRLVRIGHRPEFGDNHFKGMDCVWEPLEGRNGIDIDLPREMRITNSVSKPVTSAATSTSQPRHTTVTLAGRQKEPA